VSLPVVEVSELTAGVTTPAVTTVLDGVSFHIAAGERVALLGRSGAGKTSLVRLLLGLDRPVSRWSGRIAVTGQVLHTLAPAALRALRQQAIAFVPQNPASALDPLKTLRAQWQQNLATIPDAATRGDGDRFLDAFGISDRLSAHPCEWSRGMQQRLLIAMALARAPRLLVMDEPTSALDPIFAAEVMRAVLRHTAARGTALLLVTHQPGVAAALTNRSIRLEAGRIAEARTAPPASRRPEAPPHGGAVDLGAAPVLEARNVTVTLGGRTILDDVSLRLRPGAATAIVGESGAGKSTLLRALLGLVPLARGTIMRSGTAPGFVSQDPLSALHPAMTCFEAIAEPLLARGLSRTAIAARVQAIAAPLGLAPQHLRRASHALSVGQAQRACLARALVANASLVVFDEPLSALDDATAAEVTDAIALARAAHGTAMLFVTHDLGFARRVAEHIVVLRHGAIVESAPAGAFFRAPQTPYGRALIEAAHAIGDVMDAAA
jgi:peptide/nickel transport system ATP-binding protein